jgi:hypothetical protein
MKTRSTLLVTFLLLLTSCWVDNSKETLSISRLETITNDISVEYNWDKEELTIWDIIIKPGISENFPKNLSIYKNAKTYVNSNVDNYLYFVIYDWTEPELIANYYHNLLEGLSYTKINEEDTLDIVTPDWETEAPKTSFNLEYSLKNPDFLNETDREEYLFNNSEWFTKNIDDVYLDTIQIYIKDAVPEAIKNGTWIEGVFIEIYY